MKLPCELVQDLLPLYHDGVCSEVSKKNVEEHLGSCEKCRGMLKNLDGEFEIAGEMEAAKPLASIGKVWKKNMKKALLKGAGVTVLIFAVLLGSLLALTQWKWMDIDTVYMDVAEIYQLEDGRILYKLDVPEGVWSRTFEFTHCEDGSTYLTLKRSLIETAEQQGWESMLDSYLMIDVAENNAWQQSYGSGAEMTRYYIGDPDGANPLLVWEKGMVLEPAPAELEARYG